MLNILHAADIHLDSPFAGLTPEQAALRRAEQRTLLDRLADLANKERVDLVLLAGDLLDSDRVYQETVEALAHALGRIRAKVFISPGNHDPYSTASPYALPIWPSNVHIFTSSCLEQVDLPELDCTVYGAAFATDHSDTSPLEGFCSQGNSINLMLLHGNTAGRDYAPISPAQISNSGLDYLALGHIHESSGLQKAGNTFWAYPGCPEGRGFDELGDKGALVLNVEKGGVSARFHSLCLRRYEILEVDLTGCADPLSAVVDVLPAETRQNIYRIHLTGEFDLTAEILGQLEQALSPRFHALELHDRTCPPRDLWARAGEDSLTGLFLQTMAQKCQEPLRSDTLQLAVRFGLAALENREDVSP